MGKVVVGENLIHWNKCRFPHNEVQKNRTAKAIRFYACDRIRTHDLLVRSQTLYPAELRTHLTVSQKSFLETCVIILN